MNCYKLAQWSKIELNLPSDDFNSKTAIMVLNFGEWKNLD